MADNLFFKVNVPYRISVRQNMRDSTGQILSAEFPYVEVTEENLRAFTQANKYALEKGLMMKVEAPPVNFYTPNALSDEQAIALVDSFFQLKKQLPELTSEDAVIKLLNTAKARKRPDKTIQLIMDRYEEISPRAMQGVE